MPLSDLAVLLGPGGGQGSGLGLERRSEARARRAQGEGSPPAPAQLARGHVNSGSGRKHRLSPAGSTGSGWDFWWGAGGRGGGEALWLQGFFFFFNQLEITGSPLRTGLGSWPFLPVRAPPLPGDWLEASESTGITVLVAGRGPVLSPGGEGALPQDSGTLGEAAPFPTLPSPNRSPPGAVDRETRPHSATLGRVQLGAHTWASRPP